MSPLSPALPSDNGADLAVGIESEDDTTSPHHGTVNDQADSDSDDEGDNDVDTGDNTNTTPMQPPHPTAQVSNGTQSSISSLTDLGQRATRLQPVNYAEKFNYDSDSDPDYIATGKNVDQEEEGTIVSDDSGRDADGGGLEDSRSDTTAPPCPLPLLHPSSTRLGRPPCPWTPVTYLPQLTTRCLISGASDRQPSTCLAGPQSG